MAGYVYVERMLHFTKRTLASAGVFTAFVAAATMAFSAYVPATKGYFNVGEIMVYTTALLMGPIVGAFAGGVGAALADLGLGYAYFAPGTLVIKAAEGFIVGYVGRRAIAGLSRSVWRVMTLVAGLLLGAIVWWIGKSYYTGSLELAYGLPWVGQGTSIVYVPEIFWIVLAVEVFALTMLGGLSVDPKVGWLVFSVLAGGVEMVAGYFFYEYFALGIGLAALVEVPFNIGQVMVGVLVALPLARSAQRLIPHAKVVEVGES
jgi:uncharacterized membrane protein